MLHLVIPESQPWENGSNYDNIGGNSRGKIMERKEREESAPNILKRLST